ncbi:uncharacterized protein F4812DRAFT_357852 [Daldinia caldariorum]|uniref:uncharacterized protein n=1 Tax=Daldinia caldariorum TaxID=326644 RepID=UPI0020086C1E|nr:uncharacterized protein F4812DRAFT_357852 [Daldinia caldariorum]KAI1468186.1 hypothetical protein F4812DRAFT_357852 [Daldinia caldariorum]
MVVDYVWSKDSKEPRDSMAGASQVQSLIPPGNKALKSTEVTREVNDYGYNNPAAQYLYPPQTPGHSNSNIGDKNEVLQRGKHAHRNEIEGNENKVMQVHGESVTLRQISYAFGAILFGLWLSWLFH